MTKEDLENEENDEGNLYKLKHAPLGKLPVIKLEKLKENVTKIDMRKKAAVINFGDDNEKKEESPENE